MSLRIIHLSGLHQKGKKRSVWGWQHRGRGILWALGKEVNLRVEPFSTVHSLISSHLHAIWNSKVIKKMSGTEKEAK